MQEIISLFIGFSIVVVFFENDKKADTPKNSLCCWAVQDSLKDNNIAAHEKVALLDSEILRCTSKKKVLEVNCFKFFTDSYLNMGQDRKFLQLAKKQIRLARKFEQNEQLADAYIKLGKFYENHFQKDSAYYYYYQGYKDLISSKTATNTNEKGWLLYHMANVQESTKDYTGAEKNTIEALRLFIIDNEPKAIFSAYNLLAITQNGLNKFNETLEYHLKAKEIIPAIKNQRNKEIYAAINANNIASTYLRADKNRQALTFCNELLSREDELRSFWPATVTKAYANRALAKLRLNSFSKEEIIQDLDKAHFLADSLNKKYTLSMIDYNYAKVHLSFNEKEIAYEKAMSAKKLAQESENNDRLLEILRFLSENEFEGSSKYAGEYFELNERLTLEERSIQEKFARIRFETDEKEEENTKLSKQKELLAGISIGLLLLGIGAITIVSQRISNEKLRFEKTQQESNQEIYNLMLAQKGTLEEGKKSEQKRISEELHDGILGQMLGIRLILSGLNERNDEAAIEQRSELIDKLQSLEEEIRIISHELNDESYKKVDNFILAIKDLFETSENTRKVTVHSNFDPSINWNNFNGDFKINIYRIVQEAIQNCIKHAKSNNIFVELKKESGNLVIGIEDDGIGYNTSRAKKGIGLRNIISRTKKLNGELKIESELGKGTKIHVFIPLNISLTKPIKSLGKDSSPRYKLQTR